MEEDLLRMMDIFDIENTIDELKEKYRNSSLIKKYRIYHQIQILKKVIFIIERKIMEDI